MCNPTKDFTIIENGEQITFNLEDNKKKDMLDVLAHKFTEACNKCGKVTMKKDLIIIEVN